MANGAPPWFQSGDGVDHRPQVGRGGAATSTDHGDAELADEPGVVVGQFSRGEVVAHGTVDDLG